MDHLANLAPHYELRGLETIVYKDLAHLLESGCEPNDDLAEDFRCAIKLETDVIKQNIYQNVLYFKDARVTKTYVQVHRQALITLAGHLLNYISPGSLSNAPATGSHDVFSQILYSALEDLLSFIEFQFTSYSDQNAYIPSGYRLILIHHINADLDTLQSKLAARGVAPDLQHIVFSPFQSLSKESTYISYKQVLYIKQLKSQLSQVCSVSEDADINKELNKKLHRLNFNSEQYADYCITYIRNFTKNLIGSEEDRITELARFRKLIVQIHVLQGYALEPHSPTLKDCLCDWLDAEIWYLGKTIPQRAVAPVEIAPADPDNKIIVDLNNAELTYLFRLLIAAKVVINWNKTALSSFIPQVFQTRRQQIAEDTLRKKLYKAESSTKATIKAILLKMLEILEKDEGGSIDKLFS